MLHEKHHFEDFRHSLCLKKTVLCSEIAQKFEILERNYLQFLEKLFKVKQFEIDIKFKQCSLNLISAKILSTMSQISVKSQFFVHLTQFFHLKLSFVKNVQICSLSSLEINNFQAFYQCKIETLAATICELTRKHAFNFALNAVRIIPNLMKPVSK